MRKLIISVNVTLDGFMAGPDCELDWHFTRWTPEMAEAQTRQLSRAGTILLGRVTYNAMAAYWSAIRSDLSFPREDLAFADLMNSRQKVVFSRTLKDLTWENSLQVSGNLGSQIYKLKKLEGDDIIIYGSSKLTGGLMRLGLIDEYILWIHPVILGTGKPLFRKAKDITNMRLSNMQQFDSGVMLLHYSRT
ncbi:dihydrofolate reductase family protein [Mucilaginibacter calamicampi]|uniref:Dihydrofolate reductase family protein n=1 Tax=Mucilaginibacter calamicampi TaxID=1302352 RepID=A0ABW2Z1I3_9SPHI